MLNNQINIGEVNFKQVFKIQSLDEKGNIKSELSSKPSKGNVFVSMVVSLVDNVGRIHFNSKELENIMKNIGFSKKSDKNIVFSFSRNFEKQHIDKAGRILQRDTFKVSRPKLTFVCVMIGEVNKKDIGTVDLEALLENIGYEKA